MNFFKKTLSALLLSLVFSGSVFAQTAQPWVIKNNASVHPTNPNWTVCSLAQPCAAGFFTNLTVTNLTIGNLSVGDITLSKIAAVAGSDSHSLFFQGQTSAGNRNIQLLNEADAGTDTYRLRFNNNAGARLATLNQAGFLNLTAPVIWDSGVTVTGTEYSIQRDADATNQLHFNAPAGASMEWSINDVARKVLTASTETSTQIAASSGTPIGYQFIGGAHTNLAAGVGLTDFLVDLERTVQFATGNINDPNFGAKFDVGTEYAANGASTIFAAVGFAVEGTPYQGANVTMNASVGSYFGDISGNSAAIFTMYVEPPRLMSGVANTTTVSAYWIDDENVFFSDTTGTTSEYYLMNLGEKSLLSTGGSTRTITNGATLRVKAPVPFDASVVFTNPFPAIWVDTGNVRIDEKLAVGKENPTYTLDITGDVRLEAGTNEQFYYTNSTPVEGTQGFRSEISSATGTINYSGFYSSMISGVAKSAGTTSAYLAQMTVNGADSGGAYVAFNAGSIVATASTTSAMTTGTGWDFAVDATSGIGKFTDGVSTKYSTANVSNPPTDAELDAAFGQPTTVPAGFTAVIDDNGAGTTYWFISTSGNAGEWFYQLMTLAV